MSEKDDLLAEAEAKGIPVDKRLGAAKLRETIDGWESDDRSRVSRDFGDDELVDEPEPAPESEAPDPTVDVPTPTAVQVHDGWPRRIAPCAWLDQSGRRHTDLGRALAAVEQLRRR